MTTDPDAPQPPPRGEHEVWLRGGDQWNPAGWRLEEFQHRQLQEAAAERNAEAAKRPSERRPGWATGHE